MPPGETGIGERTVLARRARREHVRVRLIIDLMADLTDADVVEVRRFLAEACAVVKRWLPEPEWLPGWQSEAAAERSNRESGPAGPWGPDPVRAVYVAAALYVASQSHW